MVFLDKFADYTFLCIHIHYRIAIGVSFSETDMGFYRFNIFDSPARENKLAKLGDAIAISESETITHPLTYG